MKERKVIDMTNSNNNNNNSSNSSNIKKNINIRFPQLRMDKNIFIITVLVIVVGVVAFINISQVFNTQTNIVTQNDRIIADIDNNTALVKSSMKEIGNATIQKDVAILTKQNAIEIGELKSLLTDINSTLLLNKTR